MQWLIGKFANTTNIIWEFLAQLSLSVYDGLVYLMREMIKLITHFPTIRDIPEIKTIWIFMMLLSFSCIGLIIVWLATKNFISLGNIIKTVEMKVVFGRLLYALIFVGVSLIFIDWLITFNNLLVDILVMRFDVLRPLNYISSQFFGANLAAAALIIFQMYLSIKIMIGYWLRVAEVNLMAITSPAMYTLWINPSWGGFLNSWLQRLVALIFTQFVQVLILVLYGMVIYKFFEKGTISSLCLAAAFLMLMNNVPTFINRFMVPDNSVQIMQKTWNKITGTPEKVKTAAGKINKVRQKLYSKGVKP